VSMTDEEYRARAIGKMDVEMRKKYGSKGGKFNFKVVVRGDSSTGKSTLLRRLRGGTFVPDYTPTPEIKTAHIPWQARSSPEDNVMLEVWDVVDRARKRDVSESLTLAHKGDAEAGQHTFPLDATMVDVYQNCHAAVFLIDPSKKWTYEYVQRELPLVPEHVPTCILINFRDYPASKRAIRSEEVEADCEAAFSGRPFRPFVVETSLLNCYGLSALSTFLHIPFLCLKRASLERALALMPCADEPVITSNTLSEGGAFDVTYTVGFMNRQLSGSVRSAIPGQVVDWDHEGERGFITRWKIEPEGEGARVTLTTYLNQPPFPVRRYFYNRVQPNWTVCHQDALQGLAEAVE